MPTQKKRAKAPAAPPSSSSSRTHPAVLEYLRELEHPLKPVLQSFRELLLGLDPEIREELKWNAPSFRTTEHFATFNLRTQNSLRLILHRGAKVKAAKKGDTLADPEGLLEWLAEDRALVTIRDARELEARTPALRALLRAWMGTL